MEIYRESIAQVPFRLPNTSGSEIMGFEVYREGVLVPHFSPQPWRSVSDNPNNRSYEWQLTLPFAATLHDGEIQVVIRYRVENKPYVKTETHTVVTPYISIDEWLSRFNGEKSLAEVVALEQKVRGVIDSYCGQSFGLKYTTVNVNASGDNKITLPQRLLSVESVYSSGAPYNAASLKITGNGWYLGYSNAQYTSIKQLPDNVSVNGTIYNPFDTRPGFRDDQTFSIKGLWGWPEVPTKVVTAANILMEDYSCEESGWRANYIESMRASDWNFTMASGAFVGTGNVEADQLLSGFKRNSMVII